MKIFILDDNIVIIACYVGKYCQDKIIEYLILSCDELYISPLNEGHFWCLEDYYYHNIPDNTDILEFIEICENKDINLDAIFDGDDDQENDITIIAFAFEVKNTDQDVVLFSNEKRIKEVSLALNIKICSLNHFCDWLLQKGEIDQAIYSKWMDILKNKFSLPKWTLDFNWKC